MRRSIPFVDMVVYDEREEPVLLVEVKAKKNASFDWVQQMARLIFEQEAESQAKYFLLAMPDKFYLWKNPEQAIAEGTAPFEAEPATLLRPFDRDRSSSITNGTVNEFGLELVVAAWLGVLIDPRSASLTTDDQRPFLEYSGLLEAIQGGRLVNQPLAARW